MNNEKIDRDLLMESRGIKKVRDRILNQYAESVLEFEILMSQRRAKMFSIEYDQAMTDWCISSNNRYAFSRVITLAAFRKKPMRKSVIAKNIGCSFQAITTMIDEAIALGYAVEKRKGLFQASEYMMEGCLHYVQERHRLISSSLIKNAQIWDNFNEIYQAT